MITTKCSRPNGSPKGNPEGLGEMMKRVLHAVQLAVPIGIITRPNIAKRSNHEVLATEREPEGQAKRSNPAANEYKKLHAPAPQPSR